MKSSRNFKIILNIFLISGSLFFIFTGLTSGSGFLIPLVTAIILAMVMNPVVLKFRSWGISRGWAVLLADLIIVLFIAFMIFLFAAQANQVAGNWEEIQKKINPKIEQAQNFFEEKLNLRQVLEQNQGQDQKSEGGESQGLQNQSQQNEQGQNEAQQQQGGNNTNQQQNNEEGSGQGNRQPSSVAKAEDSIKSQLPTFIQNVFTTISNLLLILVYIFFFLYYREKFENTVVGLAGNEHEEKTKDILQKVARTAQHYLFGRFLLILILAGMYMAGFTLLGLQYAVFISILAALFSLVPYIGNVAGLFLALGMSFISGDSDVGQIIAILVVFSIIQFVESYILEPYVVGKEVDLNPVVVIVGVVLGGIVWGIMGMILAIPILGILKVVLDNIPELRPLGYALDERDISSGEDGKQEKIKQWFRDRLNKLRHKDN